MAKRVSKPRVDQVGWNRRVILTAAIASFLLVISVSAAWANQYLFNTANFARTTTEALTSESSRQAIATGITERIFADRPVLLQVAGDTSTKLISGLLDTPRFESALNTASSRLQTYATSDNRESVVLNLEGVKNTIDSIVRISGRENETQIDTTKVPDEIVIVDTNQFPSYYRAGLVLLWLGPITLLAALALLAYPYLKNRVDYVRTMVIQGTLIMSAGILAMLVGPLFRPPFLNNFSQINGRIVAENLYNGFVGAFSQYVLYLFLVGALVTIVGGGLWLLPRLRGTKS